nr:hypothetical protein [Tanacetum cinerariifolium]
MDDKSLEGVLNSNEMGLEEILGFCEGLRSWKTKIEVEVDRKLESEVSGLKNELGKQTDDESLEGVTKRVRKQMDDKSLEGVLNSNEMGLEEILGFCEGLRSWKTKIEVEVDRKLESEVSGLKNELGKQTDDESLEGTASHAADGLGELTMRWSLVRERGFGEGVAGESGFIEIKIRIAIVPEMITLEHVVD